MSDDPDRGGADGRDAGRDPKQPANVLDSILCKGGPMPPASLPLRTLALLLDTLLLGAAATLIIGKVALPLVHPGAIYEFQQWLQAVGQASSAGETPRMEPELIEAMTFAQNVMVILFWTYFAIGEAFFHGTSLGKRACRVRTVSVITLDAPNRISGIIRAGAKTFVLFYAVPLLLIDLVPLFFNRRRQTGHDLVTRTAVIDEKFVKTESS